MRRVRSGLDPATIDFLFKSRPSSQINRYRISLDSPESNKIPPFVIAPRLPIVWAVFRIHHDYTRPFYSGSPLYSRMIPNVIFDDWCQVSLRQVTFIAFNDHHSITLTGKYVYFHIFTLWDLDEKEWATFCFIRLISSIFFFCNYFNITLHRICQSPILANKFIASKWSKNPREDYSSWFTHVLRCKSIAIARKKVSMTSTHH